MQAKKKVHIIGQLTQAQYCCLSSFPLSSSIFFYLIYFYVGSYIFYFYYFVLSWFSHKLDWISTKPTTVGNCTHCSISHSEEIKYTADNSLSIGEAGIILKNKPKKIPVIQKCQKFQTTIFFTSLSWLFGFTNYFEILNFRF